MEVIQTEHKVRDICEVYLKCIHAVYSGGDAWLCPRDSVLAAELASDLPSLKPGPHLGQQKAQSPRSARMEYPTEFLLPVSDVAGISSHLICRAKTSYGS